MNAEQAKKLALDHKKKMEAAIEIKKHDAFKADVDILTEFFNGKIDEAVNKGMLTTSPISFPADRFSQAIITEVTLELKSRGFHLNMEKHNAYNKLIFTITWN